MLAACRSQQPIPVIQEQNNNSIERKVSVLLPVSIPGDSATLKALFECDSTNRVLMKGFEEHKTKNVQSSLQFNNGILSYKARKPPDTVYMKSDTIYKQITREVKVTKDVNYITKWHKIRMRIGDVIMLLTAAAGLYQLIKLYLKFKKL